MSLNLKTPRTSKTTANTWDETDEEEPSRLPKNYDHLERDDESSLPPEPRNIWQRMDSKFQSRDDLEFLLNEDLLLEIEKQYLKSNNKHKNSSPITSTKIKDENTPSDQKPSSSRNTSHILNTLSTHNSHRVSSPQPMEIIHIIKGVVNATGSNCYKIITEQFIKDIVNITKTSLMWITNISKTDNSSCILELKSISSLKKKISPCEKVVRISVYSSQKGRPRKCMVSTSHHPNFGFKVLTEEWIFEPHFQKDESLLPDTITFQEHLVLRYLCLTFIGSQTFSSTHRMKHLSVTLEDNISNDDYLEMVRQEIKQVVDDGAEGKTETSKNAAKPKHQHDNHDTKTSMSGHLPFDSTRSNSSQEMPMNKEIENNYESTSNQMLLKILNTSTQSDQFTNDSLLEDLDNLRDEMKRSNVSIDSNNDTIEPYKSAAGSENENNVTPLDDDEHSNQQQLTDEELIQKEIEEIEAKLMEKKQKLDSLNNSPVKNLVSSTYSISSSNHQKVSSHKSSSVSQQGHHHGDDGGTLKSTTTLDTNRVDDSLRVLNSIACSSDSNDDNDIQNETQNHEDVITSHIPPAQQLTKNLKSLSTKKIKTTETLSFSQHSNSGGSSGGISGGEQSTMKLKDSSLQPIVLNIPNHGNELRKSFSHNNNPSTIKATTTTSRMKNDQVPSKSNHFEKVSSSLHHQQQPQYMNLNSGSNVSGGTNSKTSIHKQQTSMKDSNNSMSTATMIDISSLNNNIVYNNHNNSTTTTHFQHNSDTTVRQTSNHLIVIEFSPNNSKHELDQKDDKNTILPSRKLPNSSLLHFLYDIKKKKQQQQLWLSNHHIGNNNEQILPFLSKEKTIQEIHERPQRNVQELLKNDSMDSMMMNEEPFVPTSLRNNNNSSDELVNPSSQNEPLSSMNKKNNMEDSLIFTNSGGDHDHHYYTNNNDHYDNNNNGTTSCHEDGDTNDDTSSNVSSDITLTVVAEDDDELLDKPFNSMSTQKRNERMLNNMMFFNVPPFTMSYNTTSPRNMNDRAGVDHQDDDTSNPLLHTESNPLSHHDDDDDDDDKEDHENEDSYSRNEFDDPMNNMTLFSSPKNTRMTIGIGHTPVRAPPSPPFRVINDDDHDTSQPHPSSSPIFDTSLSLSSNSSTNNETMRILNENDHSILDDMVNHGEGDKSFLSLFEEQVQEHSQAAPQSNHLNNICSNRSNLDILKQLEEEMTKSLLVMENDVLTENSTLEQSLVEKSVLNEEGSMNFIEDSVAPQQEVHHDDPSPKDERMTLKKEDELIGANKEDEKMNDTSHLTQVFGETIQIDEEEEQAMSIIMTNTMDPNAATATTASRTFYNMTLFNDAQSQHDETHSLTRHFSENLEDEHDIIQSFLEENNATSTSDDSPNVTPRNHKTAIPFYLRNSQSSPLFHTPSLNDANSLTTEKTPSLNANMTTNTPSSLLTPSRLLLKGEPTRLFSLKKGIECFQHVYDMKKKNFKKSKRLIKLDRDSKILTISRKSQLFKKSVKINIYKDLKWLVYGPYSKTFKEEIALQQALPHSLVPWKCFSMVTVHGIYCFEISNQDKELDDLILGLQFLTQSCMPSDRPIYTKHSLVMKRLLLKREFKSFHVETSNVSHSLSNHPESQ
ncbi:hypothetical protein FDP41_007441 [Naegleria fowleri]|uniref:Uncharacterized protein n=1 Tax=Naegleria fowleri TaxID=5763 RepID=A0A6A5CCH9_NAEFO|nr:uncharacterized protein FDP41_007441 [Naegleria fowleri]KAF0984264.1 hypothetical protein FDP41_007441 [Naegleria fowleri]